MTARLLVTLSLLGAVASLVVACGAEGGEPPGGGGERSLERRAAGERAPTGGRPERPDGAERRRDSAPAPRDQSSRFRLPRCPADAAACRRAGGRVLYVEAVDPDGGGDAHLVLASPQSVTASGVTVVDLERDVRPVRLPRPGDWVGAAGPVYRGSHGQRQIEARALRVRRIGR